MFSVEGLADYEYTTSYPSTYPFTISQSYPMSCQ